MISNSKCSNCGFYEGDRCLRRKQNFAPDDYCNLHMKELNRCENCGVLLIQPLIVQEGEEVHTYCVNCYRSL